MEAEQVVIVEQGKSKGNPFVLFIFFVLTLALHYLLPLLGTLYAETHPRKWIAYWIILLPLNYLLRPLLALVVGPTVAAFLHLVLGLVLLYLSSSEKADLIVEGGDIGVAIATQQYEAIKEKVTGLLRQQRLIE